MRPNSVPQDVLKAIEQAKSTGCLDLSSKGISDLSFLDAHDLSDVTSADLSGNKIRVIPLNFLRLSSLESLTLHHNSLESIEGLPASLTSLNLSRNLLKVLSDEFFELLPNLRDVDLSSNALKALPEFPDSAALTVLNISNNALSALPTSVSKLNNLREIHASRNQITELPEELCVLSLTTLDVSSNRIATLPRDLCEMKSLENLTVAANPLTTPPADVCTKGRVHIFRYLADLPKPEKAAVVPVKSTGVVGMFEDVIQSVFQPGVNQGVVQFLAVIFVLLFLMITSLLIALGPNIHILIMSLLAIVLAGLMFWYVQELLKEQRRQEAMKAEQEAVGTTQPASAPAANQTKDKTA